MTGLISTDIAELAARAPVLNDRMTISWIPIDKLFQSDRDPRRYSKADIAKAEAHIRQFGLRLPLLIDPGGRVLAHFHVVMAARRQGYSELPVVRVADLEEVECNALSVGLNRIYELGRFDVPMLGEILQEIEIKVPHISFDSLGLDQAEVDRAIMVGENGDEDANALVPSGVPVSRVGDVWLCDRHRIICGNAGDPDVYSVLMEAAKAAVVFTDMPYGCKVDGFVSSRGHREFVEASGELDASELEDRFRTWCQRLRENSRPGALVYLCIDWRSMPLLVRAGQAVFGELINLLVWVKDRSGMGSLYRSRHELVLLFRVPGAMHRNNVELGRHGRDRSNVWFYPSALTSGRNGSEGDLLAEHPTPKPKEMIADALLDCTKRRDIVLDPFLGSGSTLIAAEKRGRICHGADLDPLYVDVAIRRWQSWTGRQAIHAETGQAFDQVALTRSTDSGAEI